MLYSSEVEGYMKKNPIEERFDMIAEINRKTNEFLEHATEEDFKNIFRECISVKDYNMFE